MRSGSAGSDSAAKEPLSTASEEYLSWLVVERRRSRNTISAYRRDLHSFESFLRHRNLMVDQAGRNDIEEFSRSLRERGMAPSSHSRTMSCIRGLYRFMLDEGFTVSDPTQYVQLPKAGMHLPKALSIKEVESLLAHPVDDTAIARRDQAILEILYATGMRVSELAGLSLGDVNRVTLDAGTAYTHAPQYARDNIVSSEYIVGSGDQHARMPSVPDHSGLEIGIAKVLGKGSKERLVPVGQAALDALDRWLDKGGRPRLEPARWKRKGDSDAIFLNARGSRITRQGIWLVIKKRAVAAGLSGKVHPHVLRHSCATHMLEGGADIRAVQEMLGHSSISTTQIYTKVSVEHLRSVYLIAHPRSRMANEHIQAIG
ncbi:MAG: tyrosine recombinase XerD [Actinobacteria bacterium]|nr:tyrosine recombinase XerD [Actinomycetota bacterium]